MQLQRHYDCHRVGGCGCSWTEIPHYCLFGDHTAFSSNGYYWDITAIVFAAIKTAGTTWGVLGNAFPELKIYRKTVIDNSAFKVFELFILKLDKNINYLCMPVFAEFPAIHI